MYNGTNFLNLMDPKAWFRLSDTISLQRILL